MIKDISKKVTKALGLIVFTGLSGLMSAQTFNWSLAGPVYNAGRIRNIVVDKTDATGKTIYAGSTSSGVFTTTNGGINWTPLDDQGTVRNISYMAQAADNTIYAATGEGFLRPGQIVKAQRGTGLYKLNGSTLTQLADSNAVGAIINRVACSPLDAHVIALATNLGIMVSTDGSSFHALGSAQGVASVTANSTFGLDVKFDNSGILYFSIGNERGVVFTVNFSAVNSRVYKSTDATLSTFSNITPTSSVLSDANYGRIELAIAPSNNQVVYASCAKKSTNGANSASLQAMFVSYDAGNNWALLLQGSSQLDPLGNGSTIASGDYAHVLLVSPTDPDLLLVGGYGFYIFKKNANSSNASPVGTWAQVGNNFAINTPFYLHENIHDIRAAGSNPVKFYFVTDAGIYRSYDLSSFTITPSFQPFYKGLVTGQFNSVSIENYPTSTTTGTDIVPNGTQVTPAAGFIGGTGGNGLNYFSGYTDPSSGDAIVLKEVNYLEGDVYGSELSKILPDAAFLTVGNGGMYRSTDVRTSAPTLLSYNTYTGNISKLAPSNFPFSVGALKTGSYFKLWENYGQYSHNDSPDKIAFYNDTIRAQASMVGLATLTTQSTFTFSAPRPNISALIDSIVIRTGTVVLPVAGPSASVTIPFNAGREDILIKLANTYTVNSSGVTHAPITSSLGPVSGVTVDLNSNTLDNISVTFTSPPFATYTTPFYPAGATGSNIVVPDPSAYYRVFATVFYKYKAGNIITVNDNNVSTRINSYTDTLAQDLNWQYGSGSSTFTFAANSASVVSNPTFVLTSGGIAPTTVSQSSPVFTISPVATTNYTATSLGNYTLSGTPYVYTLTATTDTTIPSTTSTYTYSLAPGNVTHTASSTSTVPVTFTVNSPTVATTYTITQSSSSSTLTHITTSVVNTATYNLNPGNITQSTPVFTVTVSNSTTVTYTLTSTSSSTPAVTNTVNATLPVKTTTTLGRALSGYPKNNKPILIPTRLSARLAISLNASGVTNGAAVVVSKNPLNLNDPLEFVRVSQTGCLTTKANGTPDSVNTIVVDGTPTLLQWSNKGSELFYATDANKLYRVSYINLILDYSPSSYSGKLNTDIFVYNNNGNGAIGTVTPNLNSPYRTTLIGTFSKRITSISVASDDASMLLTFDDPTGAELVAYTNANIATSNTTNINWAIKGTSTNGLAVPSSTAPLKIYCSLMEKHDPKKVLVGTDYGIFYSSNVTNGTWTNINNNQLPNVQIFDIKQQTLRNFECYNPDEIYVATNGRGVWTNKNFMMHGDTSYVGIKELKMKDRNLSIYPNPTNGNVTVSFNGVDGESAAVQIMDLSGRLVKTETLGKLNAGEANYTIETSSLNAGIYLVQVKSNANIKRIEKLVIAK